VPYPAQLIGHIGPPLVLTVAGIALFRRSRTPGSALVAIGFAASLLAGIAHEFANYKLAYIYQAGRPLTVAELRLYGWCFLLDIYGSPTALCGAGAGLLWHVLGRAASPNNRWRGP
jgi:hypothetical protein